MSDITRDDLRVVVDTSDTVGTPDKSLAPVTPEEFDALARAEGYVRSGAVDEAKQELLRELMDAAGVYNDGRSTPKQLWEKCIRKVSQHG